VNIPSERLRSVGLQIFFLGAMAFVVFSLLVPGTEPWKRIATIGFWGIGVCGIGLYAYALFKIWRSR
jgi:hypothetical protein